MMNKTLVVTLTTLSLLGLSASGAMAQKTTPKGIGIAAVVNKRTITLYELNARTRLVTATSGIRPTGAALARIRNQVLDQLITEQLQKQEAERIGVNVSDARINNAIRNIERRNNLPKGQLRRVLAQRRVSMSTLRQQIEAAIAWATVVGRQIRPNVTISDRAVTAELARLAAYKNQVQYRLREIYLPAGDSKQAKSALATARRLILQIRRGANFAALARQFSQSGTASVGGDMGELLEGQLAPSLRSAVAKLKPGQVVGPVRSAGGYYLVQLLTRQTIGKGVNDKKTITYGQVGFRFLPTQTPTARDELRRRAKALSEFKGTCGDFTKRGKDIGADSQAIVRSYPFARMTPELRKALQKAVVGKAAPVVENKLGLFVVMRCRPEVGNLPSRNEIRQQLQRREVAARAQRLLRSLRRKAYITKRL